MLRFSAAGPKQNIVLNNFLCLTAAGLKKYSKNWRYMVIDIVTVLSPYQYQNLPEEMVSVGNKNRFCLLIEFIKNCSAG